MNCKNTDCAIYSSCRIKDVAHHCVLHKKMLFSYGDTIEKGAELSINSQPDEHETGEKVENSNSK